MKLHLAKLILNLQSRQTRQDVADPYDMHRSLSRAFPRPESQVTFLWRLEDTRPGEPPVVLVQSEAAPNWQQLPERWLINQAQQRAWEPEAVIHSGQWLRFRVLANPTVTTVPKGVDVQGSARGRRKRLGLTRAEDQLDWLQRQSRRLGLGSMTAVVVRSNRLRSTRKKDHPITVVTALLEGQAQVTDPAALATGLKTGIGHARMLGLGLVSVAPL